MSPNAAETATRGSPGSSEPATPNPHHAQNRQLRLEMIEVSKRLAAARAHGSSREVSRLENRLDRIKAEIFLANRGLVAAAVRKFRRNNGDSSDYYAAATEGFFEALFKWDPDQGAELGTFARQFINGKLMRAVHAAEATGISYGDWTSRSKVKAKASELERTLGRAPTDAEIAEATGLTVTRVHRVRTAPPRSLSETVGDGDLTLGDLVAEAGGDEEVDDLLGRLLDGQELDELTSGLSRRETWVLVRRLALDGAPQQTLIEVAAEVGLGREVLRRSETRARQIVTERLGLSSAVDVTRTA